MSKGNLKKKINKNKKNKICQSSYKFYEFKKILYTLRLKRIKNVGGYYPINSEIGCLDVLEKLERK